MTSRPSVASGVAGAFAGAGAAAATSRTPEVAVGLGAGADGAGEAVAGAVATGGTTTALLTASVGVAPAGCGNGRGAGSPVKIQIPSAVAARTPATAIASGAPTRRVPVTTGRECGGAGCGSVGSGTSRGGGSWKVRSNSVSAASVSSPTDSAYARNMARRYIPFGMGCKFPCSRDVRRRGAIFVSPAICSSVNRRRSRAWRRNSPKAMRSCSAVVRVSMDGFTSDPAAASKVLAVPQAGKVEFHSKKLGTPGPFCGSDR
jgi:hypothetical protein